MTGNIPLKRRGSSTFICDACDFGFFKPTAFFVYRSTRDTSQCYLASARLSRVSNEMEEMDGMTAEHLIKSIAGIYTDCLNLALDEARKNIASDSMDLGTMVSNATWSAYCEGLEAAIGMVDLVMKKSLQVLAEQRMKTEDPKVQ